MQDDAVLYGVDWNGPMPENYFEDDVESVVVPECLLQLTDKCLSTLTSLVPPLSDSVNYGVDLYTTALNFVQGQLN